MTGLLAEHAAEVRLWCRSSAVASAINETRHNPRHLTDYGLAPNVVATADAAFALESAEAVILALPSSYLRQTCALVAPHVPEQAPVVVLTKGVEPSTHELMLDVAADELGNPNRMAVLSGPNHAEEICLGKVSAAVLASSNQDLAESLQGIIVNPNFRVYVSDDVCGVEVCGAVKNVIAIACGIAAGLDAGDNTLAVLMTRGIAEITRIASALGANPITPMGLAGMGDLVATCTSRHSRNRTFGEALVAGETLEGFEARTHAVVEGARAAKSVLELAREHSIEVPITAAVNDVLFRGVPVDAATDHLLGRRPREEFYGVQGLEKEES